MLRFVVFLGSSLPVLRFVGGESQPDTIFSITWFGNHCPVPEFLLNTARRLPVAVPQGAISLSAVLLRYKTKV